MIYYFVKRKKKNNKKPSAKPSLFLVLWLPAIWARLPEWSAEATNFDKTG